jgi:hypothetical protein
MKKVIEKRQVIINKEIERFETSDGERFNEESDAIKHEEIITRRKFLRTKFKYKKITEDIYGVNDSKYDYYDYAIIFLESVDESIKKELIELFPSLLFKEINKPGWAFIVPTCDDDGGINGDKFISIEDTISEKEAELKRLYELRGSYDGISN